MLDQILEIGKNKAQGAIVENNAIDNQYNDAAIQTTAESIKEGLMQQLSGGNMKEVLNAFSSKTSNTDNPVVQQIIQVLTQQLGGKFNLNNDTASGIASSLIPSVMDQLVKKVHDSNDSSIDLNGVLGSLTGKSGINFNDMMQKFDKGYSDGFGLDDAMDMLQGKGGLAGLGGLFGKK